MQKGSLSIRRGRWIFQFRRPRPDARGGIHWTNTSISLGPAEGPEAISRREAEAIAAEVLARVLGGAAPEAPSSGLTVAEAADLFLRERARELSPRGHEHYEYLLRQFVLPRLGARTLASVRSSEIQQLLDDVGQRYSHQTCQHVRAALSALWKHSQRYDRADNNPVQPTKASGRRTQPQRPLTPEEARALLRELPADIRALVEFLLLTGLRIGEALGLQRQDVNLSGRTQYLDGHVVPHGCIIVRRAWGRCGYGPTKTFGSMRVVPLTSRAEAILLGRLAAAGNAPDAPLFTTARGAIIDPHNVAARVLKPAGERAGVPWVHWHTFRHTAATLAELDALERQRVLGHTQAATTVRYAAPVAERVREGLSAVEDVLMAEEGAFDPGI